MYWEKIIQGCLDTKTKFYQEGENYKKIASQSLVGIHICEYVKKLIEPFVKNVTTSANKLGVGGKTGNKGGCSVRF